MNVDYIFLLDVEEWDEAKYAEVNFGDIPEALWKIFPSKKSYIVTMMKFAGFVNREAILRLKCERGQCHAEVCS